MLEFLSAEEVEQVYADELASRGWTEGGGSSGIRTTGEFGARAWHKDDGHVADLKLVVHRCPR